MLRAERAWLGSGDMAIQLGFDDSLRITSYKDADSAVDLLREKYRRFTLEIDGEDTDGRTYWRIVFAILSVHSPIDATFASYRALRLWSVRTGRFPKTERTLRNLISASGQDGVVQYIPTKAIYLSTFDAEWRTDRTRFTRNGDTDDAWRWRLRANVKGLGIAKASFAVALVRPQTSTVCCIDTHIYQLFTGRTPRHGVGKREYLDIESRIRKLGKRHRLGCFATQGLLWDAKRGIPNAHTVLAH
jgi:thermostable 8-oxoguanine DNA glycosylase